MARHRRDESLFADHEDIAQRHDWRRRERRHQRLLKALGLASIAGLGALWWQFGPAVPAFTFNFPGVQSLQPRPASAEPPTVVSADLPAERLTSVVLGDEPRPDNRPRELNDCLAEDNLIDERVVACRFGEVPRSTGPQPASGMVSDRYLAEYRAERVAERRQPGQRSSQIDNEAHWIRGWDGGSQYLAHWQAVNNQIDGTSVCANHRAGSIDHRECRKAAKVHFREECRRWERGSGPQADRLQERFCHAASAFNPM